MHIRAYLKNNQSFTILELLIVIGILGVLSSVAILILNPLGFFARGRDSNRIADIHQLNTGVELYKTLGYNIAPTPNIIHISVPDTSTVCGNLDLPVLPSGWIYQCKTSSNFRKTDGSGWVPVNFSSISAGSPFSTLPVDPINDASKGLYYAYINGGIVQSYEFIALLESDKYLQTIAATDNGSDPAHFELGNNLNLWNQASGLVGYWKFDNNTNDSSGNNLNGTPAVPATYPTGKVNQAMNFNGVNQYVNLGIPTPLQITSDLSLSAWIYANNVTCNTWISCGIISKHFQTSSYGWSLFINTTLPDLFIPDFPMNGTEVTGAALTTGQWYHLVGVFDPLALKLRMYTNGIKTGEVPYVRTLYNDPTVPVYIGRHPNAGSGNPYFNGYIDEVRVHNRVLTDAEISAMYNATQ
ncbi:MAG TPA: LamG-like jellyroll fold domain-containing protein [Candidatus Paceibacterota bacterium]